MALEIHNKRLPTVELRLRNELLPKTRVEIALMLIRILKETKSSSSGAQLIRKIHRSINRSLLWPFSANRFHHQPSLKHRQVKFLCEQKMTTNCDSQSND